MAAPSEGFAASAWRWLVVAVRAACIACPSLIAVYLAVLPLAGALSLFWAPGVSVGAALGALLAALALAVPGALLGRRCYRGAAATVQMAQGRLPARLDVDMPMSLANAVVAGVFLLVLMAIAAPMFSGLIRKSKEGAVSDDGGGWLYDNAPGDAHFGGIWVNCTYTDTKGSVWSAY